jgi:MFS family permease
MCLPSATSLISENFSAGKLRNLAFSFMGGGQPIGFGVGIIFGGLCADTIGWRWGFHSAAIANTAAFLLSWWQLPKRKQSGIKWDFLLYGIDWLGAIVISAALALLSWVLVCVPLGLLQTTLANYSKSHNRRRKRRPQSLYNRLFLCLRCSAHVLCYLARIPGTPR